MARHVTTPTATAVANNLSRVHDDDIVVVSEVNSSIYIRSYILCSTLMAHQMAF